MNAFVPFTIENKSYLVAGYTCTPLVKFPISDLKPGSRCGHDHRRVRCRQSRARHDRVPKGRPAVSADHEQQPWCDEDSDEHVRSGHPDHRPVTSETGGVPFEKVTSMTGVEQLDRLDDQRSIVIARNNTGAFNLKCCRCPSGRMPARVRGR